MFGSKKIDLYFTIKNQPFSVDWPNIITFLQMESSYHKMECLHIELVDLHFSKLFDATFPWYFSKF